MGCRLRVATKYDVEFAGDHFNHQCGPMTDFILELCQDDEAYCTGDYRHIEIDKKCFKRGIETLREYEFYELPVRIQDMGYTPDELANILQSLLNESAPNLDSIILSWH